MRLGCNAVAGDCPRPLKGDSMEKQHRNGNRFVLFAALLIAVALVSSGVTAFLCTHTGATGSLQPLAQMAETIRRAFFYYDETANGNETLVDAALRGMLSSIDDDYAQYYTAEQYAEHLKSNSGEYRGIGIVVGVPDQGHELLKRRKKPEVGFSASMKAVPWPLPVRKWATSCCPSTGNRLPG